MIFHRKYESKFMISLAIVPSSIKYIIVHQTIHQILSTSKDSSTIHQIPSTSKDSSTIHQIPSTSKDSSTIHQTPSTSKDNSIILSKNSEEEYSKAKAIKPAIWTPNKHNVRHNFFSKSPVTPSSVASDENWKMSENSDIDITPIKVKKGKSTVTSTINRKYWTDEENALVNQEFGDFITNKGSYPSKSKVKSF